MLSAYTCWPGVTPIAKPIHFHLNQHADYLRKERFMIDRFRLEAKTSPTRAVKHVEYVFISHATSNRRPHGLRFHADYLIRRLMNFARPIRFAAATLAVAAMLTSLTTHAQQIGWPTYNGGVDGDHDELAGGHLLALALVAAQDRRVGRARVEPDVEGVAPGGELGGRRPAGGKP